MPWGRKLAGVVGASALVLAALLAGAPSAVAVDTDMSIDTTSIDFGTVDPGSTAGPAYITLTNTGGDPFGPINMFGGAPPTAEYNASQNCQGVTLAAGASCQVGYTFSPGAAGPFTDTSSFTVSETASQSDGEDFSVALAGCGAGSTCAPTATTATTTTTAPTTPATPAPGTPPPPPGAPGDPAPPGAPVPPGTNTSTTGTPLVEKRAVVARREVVAGQVQTATARGFRPGEVVSAEQRPEGTDLGSQIAEAGGVVKFSWTVSESARAGRHQFVAIGEQSGSVAANFTVLADESDSGPSPLLIALIAAIAALIVGGLVFLAYRRGRRTGSPTDPVPAASTDPRAEA